jgi:hypothetical protein
MPSYEHSPDVRKARVAFARASRTAVTQMNLIQLDPDLSAEAKVRRIEPHQKTIRELTAKAKDEAAAVVAAAKATALANRPAALRRAQAFAHPNRATAIMALIQGAGAAELLEMAKLATSAKDEPAAYAIAVALDQGAVKVEDKDATAIRTEIDRAFSVQTTISRNDYIVARAEALRLEMDADALLAGGKQDPLATLNIANRMHVIELTPGTTESISSDELEALYAQAGLTSALPAETLALVNAVVPSSAATVLADPLAALQRANADAELTAA